jgi:ABC-type glycerol-3-phosphate transport system substrate-binding protein
LPASQLHNRSFHIEGNGFHFSSRVDLTWLSGDAKSWNEIIAVYEAKHPGTKIEVTYKPLTELEMGAKHGEGLQKIFAALILALVTGKGKHDPATLDNKEYPGWNPKGFAHVM